MPKHKETVAAETVIWNWRRNSCPFGGQFNLTNAAVPV